MASFRPNLAARDSADTIPMTSAADDMLGPVIAGAYARGVAETLELLGLPGVFLGSAGEVLFVSRAAAPLLQGPLRLHMQHLVADAAPDNQLLGGFIADAVGAAETPAALTLPGAALELRRLPRTAGTALPAQRLRAVILIADGANPRHADALHLVS